MNRLTIPLFPLNTVLFPGGPLPLRVFEPRYLDMVSRCLKTNTAIGICLIQDGNETGEAAQTYDVGTLGHITYWQKRSDGLLGITVRGEQRFRICSRNVEPSQLIVAEVEPLPNDPMILPAVAVASSHILGVESDMFGGHPGIDVDPVEALATGQAVGDEAQTAGLEILSIKDITPIPHNGCRPPKRRRV